MRLTKLSIPFGVESIISATLVKLQADGFYCNCFCDVQPAWPEAHGIRYLWI